MNILFHVSKRNDFFSQIKKFAQGLSPAIGVSFSSSTAEMASRLSQVGQRPDIAVMALFSRKELDDVVACKHLISDTRNVLILPDNRPETYAAGLSLFPRFFATQDEGLETVLAVVTKMLAAPSASPNTST